jgi:glucose-1-phosphate adenylyltransferase
VILLPDWESGESVNKWKYKEKISCTMGIYIFNRAALELMSDPETEDFGKEIIPQVVVIKYFKYSI